MGIDEIWWDMIWHVNSTPHRCIFGVGGIARFCKVVYWCFSMTGIVTTCHVAAQLQCFWESYPSFWKWDLVTFLVGQGILLSHYFAVSQHPSWHATGALAFHDLLSQKMPHAYTFGSYFAGKFASQFLIAIHTLQQAGCHPLVIAGTVVFLTWFSEVAWPFRFNDEVLFWKGYLSVQCIACIFAWSILTIYSVNYFVHLRALREVSRSDVGTHRFCHNSIQVPNVSVGGAQLTMNDFFVRRVFFDVLLFSLFSILFYVILVFQYMQLLCLCLFYKSAIISWCISIISCIGQSE